MANPKIAEIIAKACADESYKQTLIANPKKVLAEAGIEVDPNADVKVLVNTDKVKYLVIPNVSGRDVAGAGCSCDGPCSLVKKK